MALTKISTAAIEDNAVTTGKIVDGAIVNADINASAAIAGTKVSPDFGSQNITTTGNLTISNTHPQIFFTDTDNNSDFKIQNLNGVFGVRDETNNVTRFQINSSGDITASGNITANGGNMTISGTSPILHLVDTNDNPNYRVQNINGVFQLYDATSDVSRFNIATNGLVSVPGGFDVNDTLSVTSTAPKIDLVDSNANSDFRLKCDGGNFHIEDISNAGNRLSIASNGNTTVHTKLGVGTTSNGGKLTVLSTSSTYEGIELQTPSGDSSGEFQIGVHQSGATSGRSLVFKRGGSDGMDTESMRIDANGRLGIGQNNPSVPLHVYHATTNGVATFESGDASALINFRDNSTSDSPSIGAEGNSLKLITGSAERVRLDSAGRLMIGTTTEGHAAGDNLTVADTGNSGITIRSGSSNNGSLYFSDGTSGADEYRGAVRYLHADNALQMYTNGSEKFRIDSTGNSHFGSSGTLSGADTVSIVPSEGRISYGMDGRTSFVTSENGAYIYSGSGVGGTMPAGDLILQSRSNQNRTIRFVTGSTPAQRMSIDSGGLKFGTDTADANGLHDYEEGTWTPTINTSLNANIAVGRYVKVGSLVMASARLDWNSNSGAGGGIGMGGLPFATHSNTHSRTAGSIGYMIGLDTSGNHQVVIGAVQNTSNIYVQLLNDNGAGFSIGAQNCSNAGEIQLTLTYRTDS